jgi:O-antigen/teichoic acid export membrane protein
MIQPRLHRTLVSPGLRNLIALAVIQGSNALIPLLIVPFAISVIGTGAYAHVAVTESISTLVLAAVLFSFEVDGVARITALAGEREAEALSMALSEVICARLLMFVVTAPLVILVYRALTGQRVDILALWLLVPVGQIFHSYWFYQGLEDNVPPAAITLLSRIITVASIFLSLKPGTDGALLPIAIGGPFAIGGIVSTCYIVRRFGLRLRWVGLRHTLRTLQAGKEIFIGNAAVVLYREWNVVILAMAGAPAADIATYAFLQKCIKMLQAVTRPLNQLFFPKVLRALDGRTSPSPAVALTIGRFTVPQIVAVLLLLVLIPLGYAVAEPFWAGLRRLGDLPGVWVGAAIMAPATLVGLANFMFGTAGLNYLHARRYFLGCILVTGIANVGVCFVLSKLFGSLGASISFVGAETLLFGLVMARYFRGALAERA